MPTSRSFAQGLRFERLQYNNPGLVVDLGVGLWSWPLPLDYDRDGDLDLVVSCSDVPYNGVYFFENPGGDRKMPVFKPAVKVGSGLKNVAVSHIEGTPRVLTPGFELDGFLRGDWKSGKRIYSQPDLRASAGRIRANQWTYVDYDGDGVLDLVVGQGHWADYGWDNAFDEKGRWTRGPLHGFVYVLRNSGTNLKPDYDPPFQLNAGTKRVDVFGMPSPNFADFDSDGDLDLLCGEFLDGFTYFQNVGTRREPKYAVGQKLQQGKQPLAMHLCMIVVSAIDWDRDGDIDLIVGQEDGRVALVEHTGKVVRGVPVFAAPVFFQQQAHEVKFGALVTPVSFDWDGDGDEDLVCGNTAGEVGFLENLDGGDPPCWASPRLLEAAGQTIRIMAGPNGSIQGPAEAKWGYTTIAVGDWDHDQLPDIMTNSIWGKVVWYRNVGTRTAPRLAAAQPVRVAWPAKPPKPAWNWWDPSDGELATQWRTTPNIVDWNNDGLHDLVMLDHEGFLTLFRRQRVGDDLVLQPGERLFDFGEAGASRAAARSTGPLRLNSGSAGKSGRRKLCLVDYDGDGHRDILINSVNVDFLRNCGEIGGHTVFADQGSLSKQRLAGHTTSPTTVDWDGDGRRQLLVGAEDGYLYHVPQAPRDKNTPAARTISELGPAARQDQNAPASKAPRNVLFIAVDDLRVELGCYGNTPVISPHIDRLATQGTLFERAYCQQAVCNPSRASLLTGLRLDTLRIWDLPTHFRERIPDVVTLPQLFKQHGYHTQNIGKIFHNWRQDNYRGDALSWSVPAVLHYNTHGADKPVVAGALPPNLSDVPKCEIRDVPDNAYFDGRIAEQAVAALRELRDRHFFLAVGFWKPHAHFNAPKKYWDMYDRKQIQPPANSSRPLHVPEIALHDGREICRDFKNRPGGIPTTADTLALRHGYYANTSFVDAQVGKVLGELDRLGLRRNTIVVFWSDHGYHLGEHGLWAKTSNFELDARVPLILATPEHPGGQRTRALVELLDLYPTLADLCGLPAPPGLEGKSLRAVLDDPSATIKPAAFTQHPRPAYPPAGQDPSAMGYSMRTDRYRYTEWRDFATGDVLARELYDHHEDPLETRNVVEDPRQVAALEKLEKQMDETVARRPSAAQNDSD